MFTLNIDIDEADLQPCRDSRYVWGFSSPLRRSVVAPPPLLRLKQVSGTLNRPDTNCPSNRARDCRSGTAGPPSSELRTQNYRPLKSRLFVIPRKEPER